MNISEILPEHVGRKVKKITWLNYCTVKAVDDGVAWIKEGSGCYADYATVSEWILEEPKKTLREKINEIISGRNHCSSVEFVNARLDALIEILEEERK